KQPHRHVHQPAVKNNYRRPASYASKGYRTRRMAVDFAVPLITNVKVAKLLVEALEVTIVEASKAALSAGFTTSLVIPLGYGNEICDRETLDQARANISASSAYGNYALSVAASPTNSKTLEEELQTDVKSLFIPFDQGNVATQVSVVAAHFASWPVDKPIVTNAKGSDLASVLLVASLNNRSVHISDVQNREDLMLIKLSKAKQLKVTCDVSVYTLFFTRDQFGAGVKALPTADDQAFILAEPGGHRRLHGQRALRSTSAWNWGEKGSPWSGVEESLPLLLTGGRGGAPHAQRTSRSVYTTIQFASFGLPEQAHTQVEVVVNRSSIFPKRGKYWSPICSKPVKGAVHRVVLHGQTVLLGRRIHRSVRTGRISLRRLSAMRPEKTVANLISSLSSTHTCRRALCGCQADASRPFRRSFHLPTRAGARTADAYTRRPSPGFHPSPHPFGQASSPSATSMISSRLHTRCVSRWSVPGAVDILRGKVLCSLFYEPSTRTSASFEAAIETLRRGRRVRHSGQQQREKGRDAGRTRSGRSGATAIAVVLRHPDVGSAQLAAKYSPVPVLNAGDGIGEQPDTGAPGCVHTIRSELGTVNGRTITLIGDLKNGPHELAMPAGVVSAARKAGVPVHQCESLEEVLGETDVLYVTRVQRERFANEREWERVKDVYRVDHAVLSRAKEDVIVMHPLPRLNEIDPEVDFDSRRAVYFRQMRYGLYIRMALLVSVLG
ncbi:Aspartate/ornithine carbamoyltransferase, partial [Lactarius akahatsu]